MPQPSCHLHHWVQGIQWQTLWTTRLYFYEQKAKQTLLFFSKFCNLLSQQAQKLQTQNINRGNSEKPYSLRLFTSYTYKYFFLLKIQVKEQNDFVTFQFCLLCLVKCKLQFCFNSQNILVTYIQDVVPSSSPLGKDMLAFPSCIPLRGFHTRVHHLISIHFRVSCLSQWRKETNKFHSLTQL